jgi:hypothetical protein
MKDEENEEGEDEDEEDAETYATIWTLCSQYLPFYIGSLWRPF